MDGRGIDSKLAPHTLRGIRAPAPGRVGNFCTELRPRSWLPMRPEYRTKVGLRVVSPPRSVLCECVEFSLYSIAELLKLKPQLSCPSHGELIEKPQPALESVQHTCSTGISSGSRRARRPISSRRPKSVVDMVEPNSLLVTL
jgi:hypothetical protein